MAREVRITIDDDEVFERMKRRKAALDLSWEEVLHRGLRREDESPRPGGRAAGPEARDPGRGRDPYGPGAGDPSLGEELSSYVRDQIRHSLAESFPGSRHGPGTDPGSDPGTSPGYEDEIGSLASAEDAVLTFDFLPDAPENRIPLRVDLRTGADGLAVEVVAVRRGKGVSRLNRFERDARRTVAERLAAGERATLAVGDGAETYPVSPMLSWSQTDDGRPTVVDVEITDVHLGED